MFDLHIKFNSLDELKNITSVLIKKGLEKSGRKKKHYDFDKCVVSVFSNGCQFMILNNPIVKRTNLTYQQFMEKYAMTDLKLKIEEAKNKTHMSLHQMSKAIGFNEHYLSAVVKRNRSEETQKKIIALLDDLIQKSQQELTHDFQGKALNKFIDDAVMVSKSELEALKKEISHKTQVAEKHADMRAKAEAELQIANDAIKQQLTNVASKLLIIGNLENELKEKDELINLAEEDYEKWQGDYWTVSRENIELINSKRTITIWLAVLILIIVLMVVYGVLHFNGVV